MIPLITQEITRRNWLSLEGVIDIIAISEMTPGPFAINSATFIGVQQTGLLERSCHFGVITPSFIIVVLIARYFAKVKNHHIVQAVLSGLRPAVIGLIASSAFMIIRNAFFPHAVGSWLHGINWRSIAIFIIALVSIFKFKIHPALMIILSAALGIVFYVWI